MRGQADQPGGFTYVDKDGEPGRRKIRIEYISDKSRRHITFSKRKAGIMKKVSLLTFRMRKEDDEGCAD
jgi:MADS-box transcription factor